MRDITIKPALNGYVVRMGCQRVVFTTREAMYKALGEYLDDPSKTEEQWKYGSLNSKQIGYHRGQHEECECAPCAPPVYENHDED